MDKYIKIILIFVGLALLSYIMFRLGWLMGKQNLCNYLWYTEQYVCISFN